MTHRTLAGEREVRAQRSVALAAAALRGPQLLMLSALSLTL